MKRRTVLKAGPVMAAIAVAGISRKLSAQEEQTLQDLDQSNQAAKALHYVDDAGMADPKFYDKASGQVCGNCMHYKGGGSERGGCALFPGYSVSADGWCSGWVKQA